LIFVGSFLYSLSIFTNPTFFIDSGHIDQLREAEMIGNTHIMCPNVFLLI
jgi:hypothetical protein